MGPIPDSWIILVFISAVPRTSSYSPFIVTMAISCIVCAIDLLVENREFFLPHRYLAPTKGVTQWEFREDVWCW